MVERRSPSDTDPFARPDVARRAALAMVRAAAMGILPPGEAPDRPDADSISRVLTYARRAGIGRGLVREVATSGDPHRVVALLDALREALDASPVPGAEWPAVERVLGARDLARLIGISVSSLRRYASMSRQTPDDVAARLHSLALVVGDLAGSYNEIGIRRWFERKRSQLDGNSPAELLAGAWAPEDPGPTRVRSLAAALLASPTT